MPHIRDVDQNSPMLHFKLYNLEHTKPKIVGDWTRPKDYEAKLQVGVYRAFSEIPELMNDKQNDFCQ